jgi:high-affinity iron transporter
VGANALIGLREGLEASLLVAILAAYMVRSGRRNHLTALFIGVAAAIALSLLTGAALSFTSRSLASTAQEAFGGFASLVAVTLVTWMVFWMRRASRGLRAELHGQADRALAAGAAALAVVGFAVVGREGLETALFLWSATRVSGTTVAPLVGAAAGLAVAVLLGWLFYRGALRLNLARFFRLTGVALVVVAAGVLAYGVHDLQEAGILPGSEVLAFDVSAAIPPGSWYGSLLKGTVGFTPQVTWLQLVAWVAYLVPVLTLFLRPLTPRAESVPRQPEESRR